MPASRFRPLAFALLLFTLLYNVGEGVVSVLSGIDAGSLTLVAFGADSYLEVLAAGAVLWRLTYRDDEAGEAAEKRAMRLVGATFLLLAAAIVFQAVSALATRESADESVPGVLVLTASLVIMPPLALAKLWLASRGNSPVLAAEAKETLACSWLTVTALLGVVAVFAFGWWWIDAAAALLMVPWLAKEGWEGIRAENCFEGLRPCFCKACTFGIRDCQPTCCSPSCCQLIPA